MSAANLTPEQRALAAGIAGAVPLEAPVVAGHTAGLIGIWNERCTSPVKAKLALSKLVDGTKFTPVLPMLVGSDGLCVALTGCGPHSEANARRIVACWNALESVPTSAIEDNTSAIVAALKSIGRAEALKAQRDDLLAALQALVAEYEPNIKTFAHAAPRKAKWIDARAAIARATGGGV